MQRGPALAVLLLVLSVFSFPTFLNGIIPPVSAASGGFSFAASGDMGSGLAVGTSANNLNRLVSANPNFFLGLGDFSYDPSVTGDVWCGQFKTKFSNIEILSGDRDTGGHSSTFGETHSYERYVNGCPFTLGTPIVCGPIEGDCYGKEYFFDYPTINPIARFIFAAPKLYNMTGVCTLSPNCSSQTGQPCTDQYGCWPHSANDVHFNWTANAIDNARAKGIGWVIVATHKLCISSGDATCSMGIAFFNMLVQKKVDLIIQAHDNAYERSKQLGFNPTTCPKLATDGNGFAVYNSGCVVDNGLGNYTRGAGSVVVVQGAWINDLYGVNGSATHPENIAEAPYFAKLMGKNTAGSGLGFTQYTVSASRIDVQTYFSGAFFDRFSLKTGLNPVPSATWSPLVPQVGQAVTFTGTATGGAAPYSFSWDFGDGSKATGTTVSHSYRSSNYFNVTLTAFDSANRVGSFHSIIALGSWNSAVPCSPTQATVEKVIGKVSIQRDSTIPSSVGADYSGGGFKLAGNQPFGSSPNNWPFSKRSLQPPCFINGISTFVELHNVTLTTPASIATYDCRTAYDQSNGAALFPNGKNCDVVFGVGNASATNCPSCYMHRIYSEIDGDWNASGTAPPIPPNPGQLIDVQGFVYWDADSLNFSTHNWSGWELHPFTAWRPAQNPVSPPTVAVTAPTPNPADTGATVTDSFTVSSSTTVTGVTINWGDGTPPDVLPGTARSDTHVYTNTGNVGSHTFTITVTATNNAGPGSGTSTETVNDRPPTVTVSSITPNPANTATIVTTTFSGTDPDGTISSFTVNWGDSSTPHNFPGTATSDTHSYSSAGSFTITITATDNSGSTGQGTGSVTVQTPAVPNVTVNAPTPNPATTGATVTVTFTVASSTKVTGITVNWGDGTAIDNLASSAASDTHVYASTGSARSQSFTITVTATNSAGPGSGTAPETVNDQPPIVTIGSVAPNPALTGSIVAVNFTSTDPDGTISSVTVDWGDSTTPDILPGTATSATHNYSNTGNARSQLFPITIIVTDNSGSTGAATGSITIVDKPPTVSVTNISPNPAVTSQPVTLTFSTTDPDGTVSSVTIDWGDGAVPTNLAGTATSATHTYTSTGTAKSQSFTITATVTDNSGSTSSATATEMVNDRLPTVTVTSVSPNPALILQTVTVTFSATDPDGTISAFSVDWGDGTAPDTLSGTSTSDTHAYSSAGSFTITVVATDNSGSMGSSTISETVSSPLAPTVNITSITPNPANTDITVNASFTVSSTSPITGITVNWGDGTTPDSLAGTATSDTHVYASTGNSKSQVFTITVSATNSAGTGSKTAQEVVNDQPPVVTITSIAPNPANTGVTVTIRFTSTDTDGTVSGVTVNWGDGTAIDSLPGTATTDVHTYASTGNAPSQTFTITVTATDNSGSTGAAQGSETANDRAPTVTVNNLSPNPANTGQVVSVTFTSTDADGSISSITVNWGDGSAADILPRTATTDTHTYSSANTFTVTVTATDNSGSIGQGTGSVTVQAPVSPPTVNINSLFPNPAATGQTVTVTFTISSSAPVTSITINWGDGTSTDSLPSTASSDTHSYTSTGNVKSQSFIVIVTATNSGGSGSSTVAVTVNDRSPAVTISTVAPNPAATGTTVTIAFSASDADGSISIVTVNWGDGTALHNLPGTATSDAHSYVSGGNFTITVIATDNSGSTGQATRSVTITVPASPSYALVTSADGKVFRLYANGTLTFIGQPVTSELRQVAWKPDGSYALISGDSAVLLKYNGTQLTVVATGISTGYNLWTVSWKPDGSYALIGGTSGLLLKYDGVKVTTITDPFTSTIYSMKWNPSGTYALIVGKGGLTLTYDGTTVRKFVTGTSYDLYTAAWNPNGQYALIGGINGTLLKFNGTQVMTVSTVGLAGTNAIRSIAFNSAGTLALLAGDNGMVLAYNGSTLALLPRLNYSWLYSVSWSPSGTAYIVGNGGTILTYSSGTLSKLSYSPLVTSQLRAIAWKPQ